MTEEILYEVESMGITVQVVDKKNVRHVRFGNSIRMGSTNRNKENHWSDEAENIGLI